jgi:hypothetical protein
VLASGNNVAWSSGVGWREGVRGVRGAAVGETFERRRRGMVLAFQCAVIITHPLTLTAGGLQRLMNERKVEDRE